MSDAKISSKLGIFPSTHTPSDESNAGNKGNGPVVSARSRADAVTGGVKATRRIDTTPATSTSTQPPAVTSVPKLTDHSPVHGATQPKAAPPSSSASSSALSTPSARTGPDKLDFSKPETIGMVEREAPRAAIHVLAGMIEQGAAEYVSAKCRNVLMARLVDDTSLDAKKQMSLAKTLLKAGADARGVHEGTPHIVRAVSQGNVDLADLLASAKANINAKDDGGNTALMQFARHGDDGDGRLRLMFLQQKDLDVNIVNKNKQNALLVAAENGDAKCMETLIELGSKLNQKDNKHQGLLITAVRSGNIDAVRVALEAEVKVDQRDGNKETALFHAISQKNIDMVKLLIKSESDVNKRNAKGETPLAMACIVGCPDEIIAALLDAGADPDILDNKKRSPSSGANPKDRGRYEAIFAQAKFFDAIKSNDIDTIRQLHHGHGLDVNKPNRNGDTPLVHACKSGCSVETIHALLYMRADPNLVDRHGRKPIFYASAAKQNQYEELFQKYAK